MKARKVGVEVACALAEVARALAWRAVAVLCGSRGPVTDTGTHSETADTTVENVGAVGHESGGVGGGEVALSVPAVSEAVDTGVGMALVRTTRDGRTKALALLQQARVVLLVVEGASAGGSSGSISAGHGGADAGGASAAGNSGPLLEVVTDLWRRLR